MDLISILPALKFLVLWRENLGKCVCRAKTDNLGVSEGIEDHEFKATLAGRVFKFCIGID